MGMWQLFKSNHVIMYYNKYHFYIDIWMSEWITLCLPFRLMNIIYKTWWLYEATSWTFSGYCDILNDPCTWWGIRWNKLLWECLYWISWIQLVISPRTIMGGGGGKGMDLGSGTHTDPNLQADSDSSRFSCSGGPVYNIAKEVFDRSHFSEWSEWCASKHSCILMNWREIRYPWISGVRESS